MAYYILYALQGALLIFIVVTGISCIRNLKKANKDLKEITRRLGG